MVFVSTEYHVWNWNLWCILAYIWDYKTISFTRSPQAMTSFDDLPADERKRQREALRRRLAGNGLRPGLLQKWQATTTQAGKFEFLKAFMLDPQGLASIEIEACYSDIAEAEDSSCWVELPLETLRKQYTTPAEVAFLENSVVKKQTGRAHPQDPGNQEMRLYWVWKESQETSRNKKSIGTSVIARGKMPLNKAAGQTLQDGMNTFAAGFGKGSSRSADADAGVKGNGKGGGNPPKEPKAKKAMSASCLFMLSFIVKMIWIFWKRFDMVWQNMSIWPWWTRYGPSSSTRRIPRSPIPWQVKSPEELRKKAFNDKLEKPCPEIFSNRYVFL